MPHDPALLSILTEQNLGTLATIKGDGRPQLSNVNYHFDPDRMLVRISLTDDRAKVRNLRRDSRAAMIVQSNQGWHYAVAEGEVELSAVAGGPDDETVNELIEVYRLVARKEHPDWDDYRRAMVEDKRLVARLTVARMYGKVD
jgi:PPOX class probable F420-dependent enzyme